MENQPHKSQDGIPGSSPKTMIMAKGVTDPKQKEAILLHIGCIRLQEVYFTLPDVTQEEGNDLHGRM